MWNNNNENINVSNIEIMVVYTISILKYLSSHIKE